MLFSPGSVNDIANLRSPPGIREDTHILECEKKKPSNFSVNTFSTIDVINSQESNTEDYKAEFN